MFGIRWPCTWISNGFPLTIINTCRKSENCFQSCRNTFIKQVSNFHGARLLHWLIEHGQPFLCDRKRQGISIRTRCASSAAIILNLTSNSTRLTFKTNDQQSLSFQIPESMFNGIFHHRLQQHRWNHHFWSYDPFTNPSHTYFIETIFFMARHLTLQQFLKKTCIILLHLR